MRMSHFWMSLACLNMSGAVFAADSAFVVKGELFLWQEGARAIDRVDIPVRAVRVFAVTDTRVIFGANAKNTLPRTDEWAGMQLWSVRLDGSAPRLLEEQPVVLRADYSSASGQVLYWTTDMDLYITSEEGGGAEHIAERAASPAFSPDGTHVAYAGLLSSWVPGSLPEYTHLRVLDLETGRTRELTQDFDDAEPIWSPDGRTLYFVSGRTQLASLWSYSLESGMERQMTNVGLTVVGSRFIPVPSENNLASWSPDGKTLLYGSFDQPGGIAHLLTFAPDGSVSARSLPLGYFPAWNAAGGVLALQERSGEVAVVSWSPLESTPLILDTVRGPLDRPHLDEQSAPLIVEVSPVSCRQDPSAAPTADPRFRLPLASNPGYSAYYDNNSSSSVKDWKCGTATYNGHTGTDFKATLGTTVYAGATGTVAYRYDGCSDVGYIGSTCGGGYGNYIKLSHGNSWYTYYAHMKKGTPTTASSVNCGVKVGLSASSGNSSGYHLHFEVRKYSYPYNDPFGGSCSGATSFWVNQNNGYPTTTCQ